LKPNVRRCISCRRLGPKTDFLRVVRLHPSHIVEVGAGMGRAAYLCRTIACLQQARKKNRLTRVLRVPVDETIYATLAAQLAEATTPG